MMSIHVEAGLYRQTLEEIVQLARNEGVGVAIAAFMREMHVMTRREFRGDPRDLTKLAHELLDNYRGLRIDGEKNRNAVRDALLHLRRERTRLAQLRSRMPRAAGVAGSVVAHRFV